MSVLMLMGISVAVSIITAVVESYFDAKKNKPIEHILSATVRGLGAVVVVYFIPGTVLFQVLFTGVVLVVYWIVFDLCYNLFKGNDWGYVGNTAVLDRFARKYIGQGFDYLFVKFFLLVVLIFALLFIGL